MVHHNHDYLILTIALHHLHTSLKYYQSNLSEIQYVHTHLILVHIQYLSKHQYQYKLELLNYELQPGGVTFSIHH